MGQLFEKENTVIELDRFFSINLDLLCIADLEGTFVKVNKSWENILGYSAEELEGRKFLEFVHPDDIDNTIKAMSELGEEKPVLNFVNRYRCKDGSYRYIEWRSQPYGNMVYAAAHDITDRIEKQKIIEEKEQNFRTFFETVDDLIFIATAQGVILHTNSAVIDKLGYSEEELRIMHVLEVHPEIYRAEAEEIFTDMFKGIRDYCPLPLKKKDGSILPVETRVWFGKWNGTDCIYGISKDLSKQQAIMEKFYKLFNGNPALMAVSDLVDRKFIEVNNAFLEKLGYSRDEVLGKTSTELGLFIDSDRQKEASEILKREGYVRNVKLEVRKKDGGTLIGLFSGEIIDNQDSKNFLTVMVDITEQMALANEIEEQRNYAQMLLNTVPSAVFSVNNNCEVTSWNKRAEQITGFTKDEIIGKKCSVFAEEPCVTKCGLACDFTTKPIFNKQCTIKNKAGEILHISKNVDILKDHEGFKVGGIECFEDITERKNLESEMIKKENILSAVASSIKQLLDVRDYYTAVAACFEILGSATGVDRVYLFQNKYNADGNGTTSQKIEWNSCASTQQLDNPELQDIPFEDIETFIEPLKEGKAFYGIVKEFLNDRTRELLESQNILSIVVLPVFVKKQFWGFIGFDECKYERLWTEGEFSTLSAFANSLERAIERRQVEEELETAKVAAESANVMKSQFLANMSHEIRTPMNGIVGFMDLLQRTNLSSEQKEYIREAKSASEILLYLINDILDFSKIEAGKLTVENTSFNLRTAVEDAVSIIVPKANEKHLEIHVHINPDVPEEIIGDPARLRQVINNLVSNAVKFTEKGEINIDVRCGNLIDGKAQIEFKVHDTGMGISGDAIAKLFKPFIQADSSTTRKFGGTGLGLAISRELVKLMDGDISVESRLLQGSTFSFYIRAEVTKRASKPKILAEIKNENILIVDDNENNRRIVRSYLEDAGCNVFESESSDRAITTILMKATTETKISLAIIDYQMPGMDGYQLAAALKHIPTANNVKMILLTSAAQKGDGKTAKEAGFAGYLTKPVRRDDLLNCISIVLGLKRSEEESSPIITKYTANEEKNALKPKILLVEDNEMNRKIVLTMLKNSNYSCDIALDGAEAVKAAIAKNYDIIFMDCQMPVMDGYQSTKKIRELEGSNRHTMIVAMTANAMEGDRKKCIDAGMDDYISKPLDFKLVFKMLEDCMKNKTKKDFDLISDNIDFFVSITGIQKDVAKEIFEDFISYLPQLLSDIEKSINERDFESIAKLAHQLKGSSGNLRISSIYDLATKLEKSALENDIEESKRLFMTGDGSLSLFTLR